MPTVLEYLTAMGLSPDRADNHLRSSFVRVHADGHAPQIVTGGGRELAEGEKLTLQPPPVTENGGPDY